VVLTATHPSQSQVAGGNTRMNNAYERVTEALERAGCTHRGNDWTCPHHKSGSESNPSLSVTEGDKGVILHCHAGCTVEEVINSIGLKSADLFNEPIKKEKLREVDRYKYTDEDGGVLYEVVRYIGDESGKKTFRQRHDENGKWVWNLSGVRRVLYRLPEIIAGIASGATVYMVEGEKDVGAVERAGGLATTPPGGAEKWRDDYAHYLRGAQRVVIVADKDAVGRSHAELIAASLRGKVDSVEIVEAKEGHDASDHLAHGYNLDEFVPVGTTEPDPEVAAPVNPMFAKLLDTNAVDDIAPPTYLIDKFIVANSLAVVFGLPGSAKSFLTIDWALSVANGIPWLGRSVQQGDVLYVIAEGLSGIGKRKRSWQEDRGVLVPAGVTWYPEPVNLLDKSAVAQLLEVADALQPVMIVVDTLARSMPGADENAPGPMSEVIEALDAMKRATKAAVVANHHTPKDGSSPRGHSNLLGAVDTAVKVTKVEGDITISTEDKQKDDEPVTMSVRLRKVNDSAVLYASSSASEPYEGNFSDLALLQVIRENCGPEGIASGVLARLSEMPERTYHRARTRLANTRQIINVGTERQPRWAISRPSTIG
jgi:AAA domain